MSDATRTWDKDKAAKEAEEFAKLLRPDMTLAELQALWRSKYLTTGHKLLARAFLAHDFNKPVKSRKKQEPTA